MAAIHDIIPANHWHHILTKENPVDLFSRGMRLNQLVKSSLWWRGPDWLWLQPLQWPRSQPSTPRSLPELKSNVILVSLTPPTCNTWFNRYSSFEHLNRIVAWMRRFVHNAKRPPRNRIKTDILMSDELHSSKHLLRLSQQETYSDIFEVLHEGGRHLPKTHSLSRFEVSLDSDRLLRVSGRVRQLETSSIPKSLIPLSLSFTLTQLFISYFHIMCSHSGVSTLLSVIADKYYVPRLRNYLKKLSRECAVCRKAYARPLTLRMGFLPAVRKTPAPLFANTGMDFARPFHIRQGHNRRPVIPGDDGLTRVVELHCQGKNYRRATYRLILLTEDKPAPPPPVCPGLLQ